MPNRRNRNPGGRPKNTKFGFPEIHQVERRGNGRQIWIGIWIGWISQLGAAWTYDHAIDAVVWAKGGLIAIGWTIYEAALIQIGLAI